MDKITRIFIDTSKEFFQLHGVNAAEHPVLRKKLRRGQMLGTAMGAAVGGALFGPVIGAVAGWVGTGPAFSLAAVLGALLMAAAFTVPSPVPAPPQSMRVILPALRDRRVVTGLWLTALAGIALGMIDLLSPLRLSRLGLSTLVIAATFLAAAGLEAGLAPLAGRQADRRGPLVPIRVALAVAVAVALLAPTLGPPWLLVLVLIVGMPAFGILFTPAMTLISEGASRLEIDQGLAFGTGNLAWAAGQGISAAGSGVLAQATSDLVPYCVLAGLCLLTLAVLRPRGARPAAGAQPAADAQQ